MAGDEPVSLDKDLVAARIKGERNRLGLTSREAAARLGIANGNYSQLESSADPRLSTLLRLTSILGYRIDAIAPELLDRKKR